MPELKKLNIGCGLDYKEGFVNLDFNKSIKADVYCDLEKKLPFKNNEFDYILADNVLEHVVNIIPLLEQLWRISKKNAIIDIYAPHFTSVQAFSHLKHYRAFGIGTFGIFEENVLDGERYSKIRFKVLREKLLYFHHDPAKFKFLKHLPINFLFNFSTTWQLACEKFLPLKFDEIFFRIRVIK